MKVASYQLNFEQLREVSMWTLLLEEGMIMYACVLSFLSSIKSR